MSRCPEGNSAVACTPHHPVLAFSFVNSTSFLWHSCCRYAVIIAEMMSRFTKHSHLESPLLSCSTLSVSLSAPGKPCSVDLSLIARPDSVSAAVSGSQTSRTPVHGCLTFSLSCLMPSRICCTWFRNISLFFSELIALASKGGREGGGGREEGKGRGGKGREGRGGEGGRKGK